MMCKCHATIGQKVLIDAQDYFKKSNHQLGSYLDEYPKDNVNISFEIIAKVPSPVHKKNIKRSSSFEKFISFFK